MLLFRAAQTNPPLFARRINRFYAFPFHQATNGRSVSFVVGKDNQDAPSAPEGILINEYFVRWQSLRHSIVQRVTTHGSNSCSSESEKRGACQADSEDGSHTRNGSAYDCAKFKPACHPHRGAHDSAQRFTYTGLLRLTDWNSLQLFHTLSRKQQIDSVFRQTKRCHFPSGMLRIVP